MPAQPGRRLFATVGCAKCHMPALAGRHGEVPPYSDLLLHDMGQALDDKIVQGDATGADWRTTPLVGLGLRQRYLHDGRATTLRYATRCWRMVASPSSCAVAISNSLRKNSSWWSAS